jgi:hypothetical protein
VVASDLPSRVQITVLAGPGRRSSRHGAGLVALLLAAAIAVVILPVPEPARETHPVPAAAAAFRYPLGCLSFTIYASERRHARARSSPCWRYGVFITVIFAHGRLALEAESPTCPVVSLPRAVRAEVAVCRRTGVPGFRRGPRRGI